MTMKPKMTLYDAIEIAISAIEFRMRNDPRNAYVRVVDTRAIEILREKQKEILS